MAKKAFLVGINTYNGAPLNGCVNDVNDMATYLKKQGFTCTILTDAQATRTNILKGLKTLVSGVTAGDVIYFHYSGHGSQVPDRNRDEKDGKDEIICPVDIDFYRGIYITDDELNGIFNNLPASVTIEIVLDCCHSGTGLRDISPDCADRYLPCPEDLTVEQVATSRELVLVEPKISNSILWGGCRDTETSADARISGRFNGAMTYYLLQSLKTTTVRKDLEKTLSSNLQRYGYSQHPQLECSDERSKQNFCGIVTSRELEQTTSQKPFIEKLKFWK